MMCSAIGASAANTITLTGSGGHYTGIFSGTHVAEFTDEFVFSPTFPGSLVSASLVTIGFIASEDIDFTSVMLNGTPLTLSGSGLGLNTAYTATQLLLSGPLTLVVKGNSGSNASYSGTFNLTVVPEPETYALMAAGLGVIGVFTRRTRKTGQSA